MSFKYNILTLEYMYISLQFNFNFIYKLFQFGLYPISINRVWDKYKKKSQPFWANCSYRSTYITQYSSLAWRMDTKLAFNVLQLYCSLVAIIQQPSLAWGMDTKWSKSITLCCDLHYSVPLNLFFLIIFCLNFMNFKKQR